MDKEKEQKLTEHLTKIADEYAGLNPSQREVATLVLLDAIKHRLAAIEMLIEKAMPFEKDAFYSIKRC
jgi:hypothetical protein